MSSARRQFVRTFLPAMTSWVLANNKDEMFKPNPKQTTRAGARRVSQIVASVKSPKHLIVEM